MTGLTLAELVDQALEHGSLFGRGGGKTLTVADKRRVRIRLQCDIFASVHGRGYTTLYYPELREQIDELVDQWRATHDVGKLTRGLRP